jgi:hypothetical protein
MIRHKDDDKTNCAVSNLAYVPLGFRQPRMAAEQGRYLVGKLSRKQAGEIKRRAKAGEAAKALAIEFGVNPTLVSNIKHGKKWKDA